MRGRFSRKGSSPGERNWIDCKRVGEDDGSDVRAHTSPTKPRRKFHAFSLRVPEVLVEMHASQEMDVLDWKGDSAETVYQTMGGGCHAPATRSFMCAMTWAMILLAAAPTIGAGIISGKMLKIAPLLGAGVTIFMFLASLLVAVFFMFAAGMSAVDTFAC